MKVVPMFLSDITLWKIIMKQIMAVNLLINSMMTLKCLNNTECLVYPYHGKVLLLPAVSVNDKIKSPISRLRPPYVRLPYTYPV